MDLTPSAIRERILAQHAVLRARLDGLDDIARRLRHGESAGRSVLEASDHVLIADLKRAAEELRALLLDHMEEEERLLLPELRAVDAFGEARADALASEHITQRQTLDAVLEGIRRDEDVPRLTTRVLELVRHVRADMRNEEANHLSPNLLKDDIITTGFIG
ncbi:MAG: hemerythrin domain-containing protein [Myxococcota bacterium]